MATSWQRVGELAAQLSVCVGEIEQFLVQETVRLQGLQRRLEQQVHVARPRCHPGSDDPVIAAVLTRFQQLEAAVGIETGEAAAG